MENKEMLQDPRIKAVQQVFLDNAMKALKHVQTELTPLQIFTRVKNRFHRIK